MPLRKHILILLGFLCSIIQLFAVERTEIKIIPDSINTSYNDNFALMGKVNLTDSIVNYGKLFLNTPYRYGASGDSSFDCSGFTSFVYRNFGFNLSRSSADQAKQFALVDKTDLQPGDLVFFNGRRRNGKVGHVGIVVTAKEDGEFDFIHASVSDGVTISNSRSDYYLRRFVKAGRVIEDDTLLQIAAVDNTAVNKKESFDAIKSVPVRKVIPAKYHYVKSGETLTSIANRYNMSIAQLKKSNSLKKDFLHLKQKLKIKDEQIIMVEQPLLAQNTKLVKSEDDADDAILEDNADESTDIESLTATKHVVKKGENLFAISQKYNIPVRALAELNKLKDGKIQVGQELVLYNEQQTLANNVALKVKTDGKNPEVVKDPVVEHKHKVSSGETLASIARKYKVTMDDLSRINNLKNGKIFAGQSIYITKNEDSAFAVEPVAKVEKQVAQQQSQPKVPVSNVSDAVIATHKVSSGETLASIARKYKVTMDDLSRINNLKNGKVFAGQSIYITKNEDSAVTVEPVAKVEKQVAQQQSQPKVPVSNVSDAVIATHKVSSGETLASIARKYKLTIDELLRINEMTDPKIFAGQDLVIATIETESALANSSLKTEKANLKPKVENKTVVASESTTMHTVGSGETLASLSRKYNISIEDIKTLNGLTDEKIYAGQNLNFNASHITDVKSTIKALKTTSVSTNANSVEHKVVSGETLSSISQRYHVSVDEIRKLNHINSNAIIEGQKLKIPVFELASNIAPTKVSDDKSVSGKMHITHLVGSGETLSAIAEKYGCSIKEIRLWNAKKTDRINAGEKLVVYPK